MAVKFPRQAAVGKIAVGFGFRASDFEFYLEFFWRSFDLAQDRLGAMKE
jgi:hypothetical protein